MPPTIGSLQYAPYVPLFLSIFIHPQSLYAYLHSLRKIKIYFHVSEGKKMIQMAKILRKCKKVQGCVNDFSRKEE